MHAMARVLLLLVARQPESEPQSCLASPEIEQQLNAPS